MGNKTTIYRYEASDRRKKGLCLGGGRRFDSYRLCNRVFCEKNVTNCDFDEDGQTMGPPNKNIILLFLNPFLYFLKNIFTNDSQLSVCRKNYFYQPLVLAVVKNTIANMFKIASIELFCTSGSCSSPNSWL